MLYNPVSYTHLDVYKRQVLLNEAVDALAPKAGGRYLDGTVGMGGHSFAIMERTGGEGFLCGLDRDTQALELARIRLAPFGDRVHLVHTRYSEFEAALDLSLIHI